MSFRNSILCILLLFHFVNCASYSPQLINRTNNFIPKNYVKKQFKFFPFTIDLYATEFVQGNVVYIEILAIKQHLEILSDLSCNYQGKTVPLSSRDWGYRGFIAIKSNSKVGRHNVFLSYIYAGKRYDKRLLIYIKKSRFLKNESFQAFVASSRDKKKDQETLKIIHKGIIQKKEAFAIYSKDKIKNILSHPTNKHYITSPFWVQRIRKIYQMKNNKKHIISKKISYHKGVDLRGGVGSPVYAIANGRVVLADHLFFEGKFSIIDHGHGIFSGYMHQSKLYVYKGERVKAGELIGLVGKTGRVTAPHLHLFLRIQDTYINALSILSLPVRN